MFGVIVWTLSDVIGAALLVIALLLFVVGIIAGCILRFGDWVLRRGTKEEDDGHD